MPPKNVKKQMQVEETEVVVRQRTRRDVAPQTRQAVAQPDNESFEEESSPNVAARLQHIIKKPVNPKERFTWKFSAKIKEELAAMRHADDKFEEEAVERDMAFIAAFTAQITAGLAMPTTKSLKRSSTNANTPKIAGPELRHPLWQATAGIVNRAQGLQKRYELACTAMKKTMPASDLGTSWNEDRERLEKELDLGYKVLERHITRVFQIGNTGEAGGVMEEETRKEEERVNMMLELNLPRTTIGVGGLVSLADTLRFAESGMKRLSKGLPAESEVIAQREVSD